MIFTGYYAKLKFYQEQGLEPIAISGKRPDFYEGLYYSDFTPRYEMFQRWKNHEITNEDYTKEYRAYLETLDKEEVEFEALTEMDLSVIQEIGNILSASYVNSIAGMYSISNRWFV